MQTKSTSHGKKLLALMLSLLMLVSVLPVSAWPPPMQSPRRSLWWAAAMRWSTICRLSDLCVGGYPPL